MAESAVPETRYARSGDVNIAYQTIGDGPLDIVIVPGAISHVEFIHELSGYTAFLQRLSRFARVVSFDKRGKVFPIASPACHHWKNEWTTFAPSWMRSARRGVCSSASPMERP